MSSSKKTFIFIETALAVMVIIMTCIMLRERNTKDTDKVSVILEDSDNGQWAAFKYGLRMAAQDQGIDMFLVSTSEKLTAEQEQNAIEQEIENGADAVIVQPVAGTEAMLKKMGKKVPVMLVEAAELGTEKEEGKNSAQKTERSSSALPLTESDHYAMGAALAEELQKDYAGNMEGKTLGLYATTDASMTFVNRKKGFLDTMEQMGADIRWIVEQPFTETATSRLEARPRVDIVVCFDNNSLTEAGKCAQAKNLHGALVYGIGNSTEAIYYLDTGIVECLIVPDEFDAGYQSLTEIAERLEHRFRKLQDHTVSYTAIRRDTLFSEENQEILFTMSQ